MPTESELRHNPALDPLPDLNEVALALWQAWYELNTIRARDSRVVDDCAAAIEKLTGEPPMPWPPKPK